MAKEYRLIQISNGRVFPNISEQEKQAFENNPVLNRVYRFEEVEAKEVIEPTQATKGNPKKD